MSQNENKIELVLNQILKFAHLEFDEKLLIEDFNNTDLEPLAIGINMLGEELQDRIISRDYLQKIIQSMNEMLFTLTPEKKIKTINPAVENTIGYSIDDLANKSFDSILLKDKKEDGIISTLISKDEKKIPVIFSESKLYDEKQKISEIIIVARDITDVKKAEDKLKQTTQQLIQSEKLSALGELAAGVAHELNQPLNVMNIISQSSERQLKKGECEIADLVESFSEIRQQVRKMSEIIDHMRIFTRNMDENNKDKLDVVEICNSSLKFFREQLLLHNIKLKEDYQKDLPHIHGNAINLEQVIINLLSNARSSLDESKEKNKTIKIKAYYLESENSIFLEISDNGKGIPDDMKEKIFEPFFTTKEPGKGTGLGLSVSNKIINEHEGKLEVAESTKEWTTFRIILPAINNI